MRPLRAVWKRAPLVALVALVGVLLAPPARGQYGYHFGRNKVQYERFHWQVLRTAHFDVYHYPEARALAEVGAALAEEQYAELENRFAHSLTGRTPLIFYASNIHFKQTNITPGFIPDGVGGFFEFLKGRVVLPANGDLQRFRRVIRHELVHVFTYSKLLRSYQDHRTPTDRFLPLWFTEGLAEYWSGERDHQHEMMMRDAMASGYFVPLDNLDRISGTYLMYKEGEAFFHFLSETYGEDQVLALIENAWRDIDFRKVLTYTLGASETEIAGRFSDWMRRRYLPAFRDAELATLVTPGLATEGFSSKPAVYTAPDGQRSVLFVGATSGYTNVYRVPVDSAYRPTGKPRVVVRGERSDRFEAFHHFESRMDVSRDGRLAFVTKSGDRDVVHTYDLDRRRMGPTYRFDGLVAVYSPAWAPDGRLAFTAIGRSGFADLYVFTPETGRLDRLTDDAYDERDPAWNPDGRRIAFSSDRGADGRAGAYNLFVFDTEQGDVTQLTSGPHQDLSPAWAPDGRRLAFVSARQDSTGRYGGHDLWVAEVEPAPPVVASLAPVGLAAAPAPVRLTRVFAPTAAAYDPVWTRDDALVFSNLEHYRFTVRALPRVSERAARPEARRVAEAPPPPARWGFHRLAATSDSTARTLPYRKRYTLDFAQGGVSQNPVLGTSGGASVLFSDMLGDDLWFATLFNTGEGSDDFLQGMNVAVTRIQQGRRAALGYGLFRYGGRFYDITDPDVSSEGPAVYESLVGGVGSVSYPLSFFRRVDVSSSLAYSKKEVLGREREAMLYSNAVALVHDNALYGLSGPMEGWRGNLTLGYTTDLRFSNVSYVTGVADVRRYWRIGRDVAFASWGVVRLNEGREARLSYLGGSWDLRGQPFFRLRAEKLWHTSHEFRFPILYAPSAYVPVLAPFGIAGLRGALFADAAHVWNDDYRERDLRARNPSTKLGETLGALGGGLRLNLFGAIVLRYDVGWAYRDGFRHRERFFRQFFFGYDF